MFTETLIYSPAELNGRMYDPTFSCFLSPDNYIQSPDFSQSFNRYAYCWNNPLRYTDPSGEIAISTVLCLGAAAIIGAYSGGVIANNDCNPARWNYSSGKTWGYMVGGAVVGVASAYTGVTVAAMNIPFANTAAIMASSTVQSGGTWLYTNGETDFTISFGIGAYNFTQGELKGIWSWGENSLLENFGYTLGAISNVCDIYKFASWDVLSTQERFDKRSKWAERKYGEQNMIYESVLDGNEATYSWLTDEIKISDKALSQDFAWAKSTYLHEYNHRVMMQKPQVYKQLTKLSALKAKKDENAALQLKKIYENLDVYAYEYELQMAFKTGLNYRQFEGVLNHYKQFSALSSLPTHNYNYGLWKLLRSTLWP